MQFKKYLEVGLTFLLVVAELTARLLNRSSGIRPIVFLKEPGCAKHSQMMRCNTPSA